MNYTVIYQDAGTDNQVITKLTPDGQLIIPDPQKLRGQARVNFLRERMRAKEAALVEKVAAKGEQNGTLYRILERKQPNHENSITGIKVG